MVLVVKLAYYYILYLNLQHTNM